jgi:hypothetical protein
MRRSIFLGAILGLVAIVFAADGAQPLNVKTGLWQIKGTSNMAGDQRPFSYTRCVTTKDLNSNPWANGPNEKCDWTVVTSTATDTEVHGTSCETGKNFGMETSVTLKIHALDTENAKGSLEGTSTGNGQTLNFSRTYSGKWMGSSCPARN